MSIIDLQPINSLCDFKKKKKSFSTFTIQYIIRGEDTTVELIGSGHSSC